MIKLFILLGFAVGLSACSPAYVKINPYNTPNVEYVRVDGKDFKKEKTGLWTGLMPKATQGPVKVNAVAKVDGSLYAAEGVITSKRREIEISIEEPEVRVIEKLVAREPEQSKEDRTAFFHDMRISRPLNVFPIRSGTSSQGVHLTFLDYSGRADGVRASIVSELKKSGFRIVNSETEASMSLVISVQKRDRSNTVGPNALYTDTYSIQISVLQYLSGKTEFKEAHVAQTADKQAGWSDVFYDKDAVKTVKIDKDERKVSATEGRVVSVPHEAEKRVIESFANFGRYFHVESGEVIITVGVPKLKDASMQKIVEEQAKLIVAEKLAGIFAFK